MILIYYCLTLYHMNMSRQSVFVGTHVIFDKTATGPPLSSPFAANINNTNSINNNDTGSKFLTDAVLGGVDITVDNNIVVQSDDDSVMSDDQYSNAKHGNGANREEDDVDKADKEEEEEQEKKIEENREVDKMPVLPKSETVREFLNWFVSEDDGHTKSHQLCVQCQ
jgi:hypothetical protein